MTAYHDWVVACFASHGFAPQLSTPLWQIYNGNTLKTHYNINRFLSPGCIDNGLAGGGSLSCASWVRTFQPFLDALTIQKVVLTLHNPIPTCRAEILTALVFANDSIFVLAHSPTSSWHLQSLPQIGPLLPMVESTP